MLHCNFEVLRGLPVAQAQARERADRRHFPDSPRRRRTARRNILPTHETPHQQPHPPGNVT